MLIMFIVLPPPALMVRSIILFILSLSLLSHFSYGDGDCRHCRRVRSLFVDRYVEKLIEDFRTSAAVAATTAAAAATTTAATAAAGSNLQTFTGAREHLIVFVSTVESDSLFGM